MHCTMVQTTNVAGIHRALMLAEIIDFVKQVSNVTSSVISINKTSVREIVSIATEVA